MDLGSQGIRFVRMQKSQTDGSCRIVHWSFSGEMKVPVLRDFLKSNSLLGASVACNVDETSLKIRKVEVPRMPEADLKEAVRWLMRDACEGPVADHLIRHSVIEELGDSKKLSLLVYAIPKGVVKAQTDFLKSLSLNPVLVEPSAVSLVALFDRLKGWKPGEFYGLIDFNGTKAVFLVMSEGKLYFSRALPEISGKDSPSFLTQFVVETQRSIDAFSVAFRKEGIGRLFLCGDDAGLTGLTDHLTKNLAVPTSILDPSEKFQMEAKPPHLYDIALGLALYGN